MIVLLQTGCWNAREINELAFVLSIGLDKTDDGFKVTAQIAKPATFSKSPTGGGTTEREKPFWVVSGTGKTIFEAIRSMASISPRRIFWAHIKVIIISERLAKESTLEILDFFSRNPELRLRTLVAVTPGEAVKLYEATPMMEKDPALHLEKIIKNIDFAYNIINFFN
jgi:spore germination protein KC